MTFNFQIWLILSYMNLIVSFTSNLYHLISFMFWGLVITLLDAFNTKKKTLWMCKLLLNTKNIVIMSKWLKLFSNLHKCRCLLCDQFVFWIINTMFLIGNHLGFTLWILSFLISQLGFGCKWINSLFFQVFCINLTDWNFENSVFCFLFP